MTLKRTPFRSHKHKQTKATDIPPDVKQAVWERDLYSCVWTGEPVPKSCACAHFIRRSQGGLGIEENILTLTPESHRLFDSGPKAKREEMRECFRGYLKSKYPCWDESKLIYKRE